MDNIVTKFLSQSLFLCLFTVFFLLSSCSSHIKRQDGAPNFYVDETKIPNAVPKVEPRAKYGNMAFYNVFGKRYYVMRSSKNYQAIGVASWYGTKFHAQRTSSGERYNMLAMTAAHKTLPLPTYVEVTNLKNHRQIIVKVNDRGPFESNRLIDLSYVAAKKLGMLGHGTTMVQVKAINPLTYNHDIILAKQAPHSPHSVIPSTHHYASRNFELDNRRSMYLQVGAYRSRANAESMRHRLSRFVGAPIQIANHERSNLYHVQVGPIKDVATANKISHRLRGLGIRSNRLYGA